MKFPSIYFNKKQKLFFPSRKSPSDIEITKRNCESDKIRELTSTCFEVYLFSSENRYLGFLLGACRQKENDDEIGFTYEMTDHNLYVVIVQNQNWNESSWFDYRNGVDTKTFVQPNPLSKSERMQLIQQLTLLRAEVGAKEFPSNRLSTLAKIIDNPVLFVINFDNDSASEHFVGMLKDNFPKPKDNIWKFIQFPKSQT